MDIRTRFAPSPTGYLHIGGLRTALYSYLYAKQNNGTYVLRIEDTDQTRYIEGAVEKLIKVMNQIGLPSDEGPVLCDHKEPIHHYQSERYAKLDEIGDKGPYIQSERTEMYQKYGQELVSKGKAYHCFCTSEELDKMRAEQQAAKLPPMYDRRCLKLSQEEVDAKLSAKVPFVIRLKMPREEKIVFQDMVRGKVSFLANQIDDQVLIKSDGMPTYHLANVVDDHFMEISHIIRGEDWLPSTPKHIMMYQAFGWEVPIFAHLPLILNADRSKLSKRQNDVSVESYLAKGYLPEALINFVALMGWNPGKGSTQEVFSLDDLVEQFNAEQIHKGGAVFNLEKLDWLNNIWKKKIYFQNLDKIAMEIDPEVKIETSKKFENSYQFSNTEPAEKFAQARSEELLKIANKEGELESYSTDREKLLKALLVNEEKLIQNPENAAETIDYLFNYVDLKMELLLNDKMGVTDQETAKKSLSFCHQTIQEMSGHETLDQIRSTFIEKIKAANLKNGTILWPLRAALTGQQFSVGAFETLWVLGKEESLKKLDQLII